ncbi:MAG: beta-lactamase family protein [Rhodobacteraceae bacterium]|nr:beta-lactamase family protein [Paracoccaceae bacterium]
MTLRLLIAAVLGALGGGPAMADSADLEARVHGLLVSFQTEYQFPGATLSYVLPDGTAGDVAVGLADAEAGAKMTPKTRMLAASVGKTLVGALVLSLESDGAVSRQNRVSQYLGAEPWFARLPNANEMTIRHLLTHTSGLPDHVHMEGVVQAIVARGAEADFGAEQAIAFVLDTPPLFEAGSAWSYTDTGYLLLGLVIENAAGRDFYGLVQERFLGPLGLNETSPSASPVLPGLAVGYTGQDNTFGLPSRTMDADGALLWNPAAEWTGGGFVSTSHDLARWGDALFSGAALGTPYLDRLLDGVSVHPDAPGILYGSGVAIYSQTEFGPVYGHGGWIPGYVSSLRHYGGHGLTIAFQINSDVGVVDDSTDLVPALEAALAGLLIEAAQSE